MNIAKFWKMTLALAGLALGLASIPSQAQSPTYVVNFANTAPGNALSGYWKWWGECSFLFDTTNSVSGDTNFGSLYVSSSVNLVGNSGSGAGFVSGSSADNQWSIAGDFASTNGAGGYNSSVGLDLTHYTNVQVTFKYDAVNSQFPIHDLNTNGDQGLVFGVTTASTTPPWGQIWLGTDPIPDAASNGWVTLNYPINPGTPNISAVNAIVIKKYSGGGLYKDPEVSPSASTVAFWIGSVVFQPSSALPPAPTVGIAPAQAGLNLFNGAASIYSRENVQSVDDNLSWFGASSPVSYSFTVDSYPAGSGFQTQIFLAPGAPAENNPDWNEPNVVFLDLENAGSGASWSFRYKTNQPNGNSFLYGAGTLATINTSTAVGTWTVTFAHNTNVTMTGPGGVTTNFNIPDDATFDTTSLFANPLDVYFGVQAGNTGMLGQKAVFSSFSVSGLGGDSFTDNFATQTALANDPNWTVNANDPTSIQLVPSGNPFWVTFTSPANGYNLVYRSSLSPGAPVNTNTGVTGVQIGTKIYNLVPSTVATNPMQGYFQALDVVTNGN